MDFEIKKKKNQEQNFLVSKMPNISKSNKIIYWNSSPCEGDIFGL